MITQKFPFQCGKMIVLLLGKHKQEELEKGKVLEVKEDIWTVTRMSGSYSDSCHTCEVRGDLWTEDITKGTVIR